MTGTSITATRLEMHRSHEIVDSVHLGGFCRRCQAVAWTAEGARMCPVRLNIFGQVVA